MSAAPRKDHRSLQLVPLSQLAERSVSWLWRGWIPMGHLTILDGDPGMGKTLLTLDMCARVTTGKAFPGDIAALGPVNAILINAEDDMEDTIKPRLRGMGADLDRVFDVRDVKSGLAGPLYFPTDRRLLDHFLTENQARLVVIDPIMSFLDRRIQSSNDQHVRRALGSLTWLARKHRCAILLVRHLNKARGGRALYRGGASIAFTASCRSVLLAGPDPQQPGGCVLAQVKQNLAAAQPSLLYTATTEQSETPLIAWRGASTLSADDLVAIVAKSKPPLLARETARDLLEDFLRPTPRTTEEIKQFAEKEALSESTLFRVKRELQIRRQRIALAGKRVSYWLLPNQELPEEVRQASWQEEMQEFHRRVLEAGKEPVKDQR
jgi:AAA domain